MNKIIESLTKLEEQIAEAKTNLAILKSKKGDALKTLKDSHKIGSGKEAETLLAKKRKELQESEKVIRKKFDILEKDYQW